MDFTVVYDNNSKSGFEDSWGFSCLIDTNDELVLFDTGWDGNVLLHNLQELGVNGSDIDRIILSHLHWDHIGGLTFFKNPDLVVHVPDSFSKNLKNEISKRFILQEEQDMRRITGPIFTTGELGDDFKEQSVFVKSCEGTGFVITGCSHPGLDEIFSNISSEVDIVGILGGMHDLEDFDILKDLEIILPCHCTSDKQKIVDWFSGSASIGKVGTRIDF